MAHAHQRPLVRPPPAALHAHETVVGALGLVDQPPRLAERAQQRGLVHHGPVGEVPHVVAVPHRRVERLGHVLARQLAEGLGAEPGALDEAVEARKVDGRRVGHEEVGEVAAAVRGGDGGDALDGDGVGG